MYVYMYMYIYTIYVDITVRQHKQYTVWRMGTCRGGLLKAHVYVYGYIYTHIIVYMHTIYEDIFANYDCHDHDY